MMLPLLFLLPAAAGLLLLLLGDRLSRSAATGAAIAVLLADMAAAFYVFEGNPPAFKAPWIPSLGVSFHLEGDTLAAILVLLTLALGILAAAIAGSEIARRPATYQGLLLLTGAALVAGFLAADLFLFFLSFEAMLLPAVALLIGWGRGDGKAAALRFFIFTQAGGLLMVVAIVALFFAHGGATGNYTFDYPQLVQNPLTGKAAFWIMLGFVAAFAIKLPLFPLHGWQPKTYQAAPASLAILLAGAMAKTGAYGLLRFAIPLFPEGARQIAPWMIGLGVAGMLYGALVAYGAQDLRRLLAYSSMSHLGLLVAGAYSLRALGYQGAVLQMVAHGLSVAGLFLLVYLIEEHAGSSELGPLGGLWQNAPRLGALAMLFVMASLGLPGLANFAGEILLLLGIYGAWPAIAVAAVLAPVVSALYSLRLAQQVFLGPQLGPQEGVVLRDLYGWRLAAASLLAIALLWLGFQPNLLLRPLPVPVAFAAAPAPAATSASPAPSQDLKAPDEEKTP
jgi:NADH-quinone oxidoreductase subunit M